MLTAVLYEPSGSLSNLLPIAFNMLLNSASGCILSSASPLIYILLPTIFNALYTASVELSPGILIFSSAISNFLMASSVIDTYGITLSEISKLIFKFA